jgi:hypothetical protein
VVAFGWRRARVHGGGPSRGVGCSESHLSACFSPVPARNKGLQRIKGNVQHTDDVLMVPPIGAGVICGGGGKHPTLDLNPMGQNRVTG